MLRVGRCEASVEGRKKNTPRVDEHTETNQLLNRTLKIRIGC